MIARATEPDLERRYASARDMAADVKRWRNNGAAVTAHLVNELFGAQLKDELCRLATFPTIEETQDRVSYSSQGRR